MAAELLKEASWRCDDCGTDFTCKPGPNNTQVCTSDSQIQLDALHSGEAIVIPRNRDHAEKMLLVAEHWLKKNG